MRTARFALLAGTAILGLAGLTHLADAQPPSDHILTIQLPNGQVEQLRYAGDVPPRIVMLPGSAETVADPVMGNPFAALEQISAAMDAQMAALMHQAQAMAAQPMPEPEAMLRADFGGLPQGGVCTQSMTITFQGGSSTGEAPKPRIVSQTSGDCGPTKADTESVDQPAAPSPRVKTIDVKGPVAPPASWVVSGPLQHG
jgi:hypothetical protein